MQDKSNPTVGAESWQLDQQHVQKSSAVNVANTVTATGPKQQQWTSSSDAIVNFTKTLTMSQPKTVTDTEQNMNIPQAALAEKISSDISRKEIPCTASDVNLAESEMFHDVQHTVGIPGLDSENARSTTSMPLPDGTKVKKKNKKKQALRMLEDIIRYASLNK